MRNIFEAFDNFDKYKGVKSILIRGEINILSDVDVTIVMSIYNHKKYLKKAIDSAINQKTKKKIAILILDNDSDLKYGNEDIIKEISDKRIVYFRNESNIGAAGNWNRGIELCRSKYLTYLHDDDMLHENAIDTLFEIKRISKADFVFSSFAKVDENGNLINSIASRASYRKVILEHMLFENYCHTGEAALLDRQLMLQTGGYSEDFRPCPDYALFTKIVHDYYAVKYLKPLLYYRIAENDTFSCYKEIPLTDDFIRKCIIQELNYPKFLLTKYANIILKEQKYMINIVFGRQQDGEFNIGLLERALLKVTRRMLRLVSDCKSKVSYV